MPEPTTSAALDNNTAATTTLTSKSSEDLANLLDVQFKKWMIQERDLPMPVAAIKALIEVVKRTEATTMSGLTIEVEKAMALLKKYNDNSVSLIAGCELFSRFITRMSGDGLDFEECKNRIIEGSMNFVQMADQKKQKIALLGVQFIHDGAVVLVHSYSRLVIGLLSEAAKANKRFTVYVTQSQPTNSGKWTADKLKELGIPVQIVLDSAVGYIMHRVDMVIVGSEGVIENGGIINQIGTYQIAVVAKAANKPLYVAVESYKFVRLFPLNQYDFLAGSSYLRLLNNFESTPPEDQESSDLIMDISDRKSVV